MQINKEIIVVAPKDYKELARSLAHEISKVDGCNAAVWTIKHFEDNEFQLGGNRFAIFIGNSDENSITKDFLPVIKNITDQAGACYGFDGSKAVIFGEGKLEQKEEFKKLLKKNAAILTGTTIGTGLAVGILAQFPIYLGVYYLVHYFNNKAKESKLRMEQTKAALSFFLTKHFDIWVGIKS